MEHKTHKLHFHFHFTTSMFITLLLLLLLLVAKSTAQGKPRPTPQACTDFVKTSCTKTTYPQLCVSTLAAQATSIQASPRLLANAALAVSLATTRSTSAAVCELSRSQTMTPLQAGPMKDCLQLLGDSIAELRKSVSEMGHLKGPGFAFHMSNVQTWVSSALTDDSTCTDGFEGEAANGGIKEVVREKIVKIAHLTSNALALINCFAAMNGPHN